MPNAMWKSWLKFPLVSVAADLAHSRLYATVGSMKSGWFRHNKLLASYIVMQYYKAVIYNYQCRYEHKWFDFNFVKK